VKCILQALANAFFQFAVADRVRMTIAQMEVGDCQMALLESVNEGPTVAANKVSGLFAENIGPGAKLVLLREMNEQDTLCAQFGDEPRCNGACLYQTLASKRKRGPSGLPPTRADLYGHDHEFE
jgi:hypothetical protein